MALLKSRAAKAAAMTDATRLLSSAPADAKLVLQKASVVEALPVTEAPPEPPPKSPEELEAEAARAEFAQIKLVGVIIHDAKFRAYLTRGEQTYLASMGDAVARFTVTAIKAESVKLHDPRTQVGGEIPVLGK